MAAGGARLVPQAEAGRLPAVIAGLLGDPAARAEMSRAARGAARPDAAAVIARRLREAVDG